jgi:uncharacterized protein involved in outer membrane biogenesis
MKLRRFVGVFFGIVGVVLLAAVLYVSFGDLGRHKSRIEALVTRSIGRPFAIDGPLKLRLVPTVDVSANLFGSAICREARSRRSGAAEGDR